jgi:hypothetical protein
VKAGDSSKAMPVGFASDGSKADPPACVLAQLDSSGQLRAIAPAQLQAAVTASATSAGATVPILNGVGTESVAGATFYVGYGASKAAMLNGGIYRSALSVAGAGTCPMLSSQTALWWNPAEPGWGINLNHQGNTLFGTLFTYDANRAPLWLVMSDGTMRPDGTFAGDLYQTKGPAFNANPFRPIGASDLTKVGTMSVAFQDPNSATLQYTVNGTQVSKGIQRQVYGSRATACFPSAASRTNATNYQDLWWNPAESGWGINITHQDETLFATLFTYDAAGKPLWLVMSNGTRLGEGFYNGLLYRTSGPVFNASPFAGVTPTHVGYMQLRFSDGNNGTLTYDYFGTTVTKQITRQVFAGTVPLCQDVEAHAVTLRVPDGERASTLAALDWTNLASEGPEWTIYLGAPPVPVPIAPGRLKRWIAPIPVKTNGEPRAIAALDEIERRLGTTLFDRTSIANLADGQITRGVFVTVGTTTPVPGESEQVTCARTMYWGVPARNSGVMSLRMEVRIDGQVCKASVNRVIHEFGHVMGLGRHFSGYEEGDENSPLFWNVLATMYANAPGTPRDAIVVP